MSVFIINPITADSLRSALPDSIWVANFPEPSLAATWAPWVAPLVSASLAAAATFLLALHMYTKQKRDAERAKNIAAYNLMCSICDEMRRTRRRVLDMLIMARKTYRMQGPILTDAKDTLLGRLAETVPAGIDLHSVFRYYEILSFVAVHHNASIEIADVSGMDALKAMMSKRATKFTPEDPVATDFRRQGEFHRRSVAFACHYFDPDDGDGLTQHYIDAVIQLVKLSELIDMPVNERFAEPTEAERTLAKLTITKLVTKPTAGSVPDPREVIDDGQYPTLPGGF